MRPTDVRVFTLRLLLKTPVATYFNYVILISYVGNIRTSHFRCTRLGLFCLHFGHTSIKVILALASKWHKMALNLRLRRWNWGFSIFWLYLSNKSRTIHERFIKKFNTLLICIPLCLASLDICVIFSVNYRNPQLDPHAQSEA